MNSTTWDEKKHRAKRFWEDAWGLAEVLALGAQILFMLLGLLVVGVVGAAVAFTLMPFATVAVWARKWWKKWKERQNANP